MTTTCKKCGETEDVKCYVISNSEICPNYCGACARTEGNVIGELSESGETTYYEGWTREKHLASAKKTVDEFFKDAIEVVWGQEIDGEGLINKVRRNGKWVDVDGLTREELINLIKAGEI